MSKYKTMKVFRTMDMPEKIKNKLYKRISGMRCGTYHSFYLHEKWSIINVVSGKWNFENYVDGNKLDKHTGGEILKQVKEDGLEKVIERGVCKISDWLFDNGAKVHEQVLIWDM